MVINQGLALSHPQTLFYLSNVSLVPGMAAKVRIAPRGWLDPCGNMPRCGNVNQVYPEYGCRGEVITQRFPIDVDATLLYEEMAVMMQAPNTTRWAGGLYEAQVILLYAGSEIPVSGLVLFEHGDI